VSDGGASVSTRLAVLVGIVLLPFASLASGTITFVPLFALPALFVIPGLLFRGGGSPPDRPDSDDGGGGGPPRGPGRPPEPPSAGPPLPDADQGRARMRDHNRARRPSPVRRGSPRHPDRAPARVRPRR
jgi:hypothetical protein